MVISYLDYYNSLLIHSLFLKSIFHMVTKGNLITSPPYEMNSLPCPLNSYVEVLSLRLQNVTVSGNKVFEEIIKLK